MKPHVVVALAGNPNSGKTTVFNQLTGARQHVGNYPGVTVERKEGMRRHGQTQMQIVDLPGTYSLTAYSAEELVARSFLINERPDVVVDILDASNLERNLYLAVQLAELGAPLVLALNMSDMADARGYVFDLAKLQQLLGARVIRTVGHKANGLDELLEAVAATAAEGHDPTRGNGGRGQLEVDYGPEIGQEVARIEGLLREDPATTGKHDPRWLALKLLENDQEVRAAVTSPELNAQLQRSAAAIAQALGERPETAIAGRRYRFITNVCQQAVRSTVETRHTASDRLDALVTHRLLGLPLFLGLMYAVFQLTFTLGGPPMGWIETAFGALGEWITGLWPEGTQSGLQSLLVDGLIGGVGGVIVFLPNILLLFLAIAVLEDTGYMARAAFIMDRLMHKIGLEGKSFIPMLIGFGCSVPAIMATRTIENRRARLTTMLVTPLMSCGARLPIYALIIPAFFPAALHGPVLWLIYVVGIVLAILSAKLLHLTVLRGEPAPFVMELPPYRLPMLKSVLIHMWERGRLYLAKAGTVILGLSILLWVLTTYPALPTERSAPFEAQRAVIEASNANEETKAEQLAAVENLEAETALRYSYTGRVGNALAPALKPLGFDWRIATAFIGAFAAKEVFVAQMGIVYAVGEADEASEALRDQLRSHYSPLQAFCMMLFALISAPCMATIAVTKRESGSWGWAAFQLVGLTVLAYVVTAAVYQIGTALG